MSSILDNLPSVQHEFFDKGGKGIEPPGSLLAEESVIGSLMIDRDAIISIAPFLKPTDFFREALGIIYETVLDLYRRRVPADPVTVYNDLERRGVMAKVGGVSYIVRATANTPTAAHVVYYARIVLEHSMRRALIAAAGKIAALGYTQDAELADILARANEAIGGIVARSGPESYATLKDISEVYLDRLDMLSSGSAETLGVQTGFTRWDQMTGGLQNDALIILAARPAMGKTTICLNIANNAAKAGRRIGIFSLEMSRDEIMGKLVSMETGITSDRLRTGDLTDQQWDNVNQAVGVLATRPIAIDDRSGTTITELSARATQMQAELGLDLIIVDYLQLVHGTPTKQPNRVQEVSEVARGLKEIARTLHIPVLACCQINRQVEGRIEKVPQLSDLKDSGEIEQAADVVAFLVRDEVYEGPKCVRAGIADVHIKKHRNGPEGKIGLFCKMETGKFGDLTIQ